MERKFRVRLNLFDGIVLVLALCVGIFLAWNVFKPAPVVEEGSAPAVSTVRYTVRFQKMLGGAGSLVEPGDVLIDNIKNYKLGTVISAEVVPAIHQDVDQINKKVVRSVVEGYEDVIVTVEAPCTMGDSLVLDGGYALRVNNVMYIKGEGYMASGPIMFIEREGQ